MSDSDQQRDVEKRDENKLKNCLEKTKIVGLDDKRKFE
jgi:hypothetical protein